MKNSISGSNNATNVSTINGRVTGAASTAHDAVDKVAEVADSAVRKMTSAIDGAAASSHQVVNKIEDKIKPAGHWITEKTDALMAAPKNAVSGVEDCIAAHPWKSIGLAVLAGVLLGRRTR